MNQNANPVLDSSSEDLHELGRSMHHYYDKRTPTYDDWYNRRGKYDLPETNDIWHAEVAQLGDLVREFSDEQILELSCGTGWWHEAILRCKRATLTALDYSPAMLNQSRLRAESSGFSPRFIRADNYVLPFRSGQFEKCFFGFWLSHVPRLRLAEFFAEVRRVCKPGATALVIDSLYTSDRGEKSVIQNRQLPSGERHDVIKIYHTPEDLKQVLRPFGRVLKTAATGQFFVHGELELASLDTCES